MSSGTGANLRSFGLAYWMQRVVEECDKVSRDLAPDPVHDLRVALRRCRSMADGLMTVDPLPLWKQMKKAGKQLFRRLGELRDAQVMTEWIQRLGSPDDVVAKTLLSVTTVQEEDQKKEAVTALQGFPRKQWDNWSELLPKRADRVSTDSLVFKHLGLERWHEAYELHHQALRNRTKTSWHQLRIGLKRFRYTVENFLPRLHDQWEHDLKNLQDLLGDIHDLDVLWATALKIKAFPDENARRHWRARIEEERTQRLQQYRQKMLGKGSLWHIWRAELPQGTQVESAALERLKSWASFLDPDFAHARHVARLALQLYDGLASNGSGNGFRHERARSILHAAALMHDVGRAKRARKHHKLSYRLIRQLTPPLGWRPQDLRLAAFVARYHCGALPQPGQKCFTRLPDTQKRLAVFLAGILRLADALDWQHDGRVHSLDVAKTGDFLTIRAQGNLQDSRDLEKIAAARHLLEVVCEQPILIRPGTAS